MPFFFRDGIRFHYREAGSGVPVVFQHGLGGDVNQPFGLFAPPPGFRLLAFDCRGHGETRPVGDVDRLGIASFADDLAALLDDQGLRSAIIGGISMGAALALNFTLRFPDRVLGLILSRPAWLDRPLPENLRVYSRIADLIRRHGARDGLRYFHATDDYAETLRESPDAAKSLEGQFDNPRAEEAVVRLERIPADAPCLDRSEWRAIRVPTLVLANRMDPIHPFDYGKVLAETILGAEFRELTPKSVSIDRHAVDVQEAISGFLHSRDFEGSQRC